MYSLDPDDYTKTGSLVHCDNWELGKVYYRKNGTEPFLLTEVQRDYSYLRGYKCDYLKGTKNI